MDTLLDTSAFAVNLNILIVSQRRCEIFVIWEFHNCDRIIRNYGIRN